MKNIIFQYYNKALPKWAEISSRKFKEYAKNNNAEYLIETKLHFCNEPYFENLRVVYDDLFLEYDRVLYVDVDVIPENMNDNIFDENIKDLGMVAERENENFTAQPGFSLPKNREKYGNILKRFKKKGILENNQFIIYNSGVILWSREGILKARKVFTDWKDWNKKVTDKQMKLDQPFINSNLYNMALTELPLKWNCPPRVRWKGGDLPKDSNFIHYTNKKKQSIEEIYK